MSQQLGNILYFLLWAGVFFSMRRFGCGAHIMGHGHHHGGKEADDHSGDGNLRWLAPKQAVDPVCGTGHEIAGSTSNDLDQCPGALPIL